MGLSLGVELAESWEKSANANIRVAENARTHTNCGNCIFPFYYYDAWIDRFIHEDHDDDDDEDDHDDDYDDEDYDDGNYYDDDDDNDD